jgi:hypothetical protein
MLREHIAGELGHLKAGVRDKARIYTDAGQIGALNGFDRLDRQIDGLAQAVRFADYGASGIFDAVKIGEAELQRLYEFDLSVLDDVAALAMDLAGVPAPGGTGGNGGNGAAEALGRAEERLRALADKWRQREQVMGDAAQS